MNDPVTIRCDQCGSEFEPRRRGTQKYCSVVCRQLADKAKYHVPSPYAGLPAPTTGAISELVVSADLLRQGYEVFRALSPACSCDLIALRGQERLRVEVRTGYRSAVSGRLIFARNTGGRKRRTEDEIDLYAVVVQGVEIVYVPVGEDADAEDEAECRLEGHQTAQDAREAVG